MSLVAVIALPCFLIGWLFSVAIRRAHRSNPPIKPLLLYPLICSAITTGGFMVWGYHSILTSRSSTAAIGFFFLPFYSAALAVIAFVVSWAVLYVACSSSKEFKELPCGSSRLHFSSWQLRCWDGRGMWPRSRSPDTDY